MYLTNIEKTLNRENELKEAIISVIVFFDMFDCPLTAFEIWKYLPVKCGLAEVIIGLDEIPLAPFVKGSNHPCSSLLNNVGTKNGFYFLSGRTELYDVRLARYNFADKKSKRAVRLARIFKLIPWIKLIAVGNIIGGNNAKTDSDIDLFIITENKKIWLTRFFCVLITKLLGLRPAAGKRRDQICLSFFISENELNLKRLMLEQKRTSEKFVHINEVLSLKSNPPTPLYQGGDINDIYFIFWLACLMPIFDCDASYKNFIIANSWLKDYLPNWEPVIPAKQRDAGRPLSGYYHDVIDLFLGGLESFFKKIQMKLVPAEIKEMMNNDTRVVVNDEVLKLHVNDRRTEYRDKYLAQLDKINRL